MPIFLSKAYLSPTLVEAIPDRNYPAHIKMQDLMQPFPTEWERQRERFFSCGRNGKGG